MTELKKANGNPIDEYSFRIIGGDFLLGKKVTVETVMNGKRYTRTVHDDSWDLYITINGAKCYFESDRVW